MAVGVTIGTSTDSSGHAVRGSHQRKIFYAQGRFWVFYSDGTNLVYRTSLDGVNWTAPTVIRASTVGYETSIFFDGTYLHYIWGSAVRYLRYRRGTPNSDGTITWSADEQSIDVGSAYWAYTPTIAVDSSGYAYVAYTRGDATTGANRVPCIMKNANNDGTWSTAEGYPIVLNSTVNAGWRVNIIALTSNRMLAVYSYAGSPVRVKRYDGASWGTERVGTSNVQDGYSISAVAADDDVHIAFLKQTTYDIVHVKYTYSTDSLGTETTLATGQSSLSLPVTCRDDTLGHLYVFWANGNHIYYRRHNGLSWAYTTVDWIDESVETLTRNDAIQCFAVRYDHFIGVVYSTKAATPYNVKFALLKVYRSPPVSIVTTGYALNETYQRKCFSALGLFWVFYSDGTNMVYQTSKDGQSWSEPVFVRACTSGEYFSVWFDGAYVHYAYAASSPIRYRRGLLNSDGTITWSPEQTLTMEGNATTPIICVDSESYPWIGFLSTDNWNPYVTKSANKDGKWSTASGFPYRLSKETGYWRVCPLPLTDGKVYVIYSGDGVLKGRLWSGLWGPEEKASLTETYYYAFSAVAEGDNVHIAFQNPLVYPYSIIYRKRDASGWGSEEVVRSGLVAARSLPILSLSGSTPYCFWFEGPSKLYYKKRVGAWDETPSMLIDESEVGVASFDAVTCFYKAYDNRIGIAYIEGISSPYYIMFEWLPVERTVGVSDTDKATSLPLQRKAFYTLGSFWVFYVDGKNLVCQSSKDEILGACVNGYDASVFFDGKYVHYVRYYNYNLHYRRGVPNSDGTITWSPEQTVYSGSSTDNYQYPTIIVDSGGYAWIGARYYNGTSYYPAVFKNANNDGTWSTASGFPYILTTSASDSTWRAIVVPLTDLKVYVIYGRVGAAVLGKLYDGGWKDEETVTLYALQNSDYMSATSFDDYVYFAYLRQTTNQIRFRMRTPVGWQDEELVQESVELSTGPVLTVSSGRIYCFWSGVPHDNCIYYKKRTETWDVSPTLFVDENIDGLMSDELQSFYQSYGATLGILYMSARRLPTNVKFEHFTIPHVQNIMMNMKAGF